MVSPKRSLAAFALSLLSAFSFVGYVAAQGAVEFNRDIRPILSNKCFACHGPDNGKREAGLRLDDAKAATSKLDSGVIAIVPSHAEQSEAIRRISSNDDDERMPPTEFGKPLTSDEIAILRKWVDEGAHYAIHWSYVKPVRVAPFTAVPPWKEWPRNAIDQFALKSMLDKGLRPSPEADRDALARRVFLDLTGLPPTVEEVDAFVASSDPQAYEKLVDNLLHRPSYGEHWARMWLDLARYADSAGYAEDLPRTIWAYRDWVIRAINNNKPFDQFTIEQIAGDLLPNPSEDQLIATAFHRNTLTNSEGGTQDEEFRNSAIVDRVNTTLSVWMGTTIACAQCHNHKYDPISQQEYFGLFAVLNNTEDNDQKDETPLLPIYRGNERNQAIGLLVSLPLLQAIVATPIKSAATDLAVVRAISAPEDLRPTTTVPISRDLVSDHRETRLEYRGNYLDKGPVVQPGLPAVFHPALSTSPLDRLGLARWLVDKNNPLTARVIANRYWEALFGRGIVPTSEDFGAQGELPSHPELLDWLANELMDSGWDTRALIRSIVTSTTYRQSSLISKDAAKVDSDNRWLARGPRIRLSAEMVRDQALAVSGLLSYKMYGPPVHPPQPKLGLNAAFGGSTDWQTSEGANRYRRAIYTSWRRSNPYPSMATFDAPNREVCTLRRTRTNTPLQSLVTLNDPVYVEAAQSLARLAIKHPGSLEDKIAFAFRRCLLRSPRDNELKSLVSLYNDSHSSLADHPKESLMLATKPLGALTADIKPVDAASMTVVANILLNLDEIFLKR